MFLSKNSSKNVITIQTYLVTLIKLNNIISILLFTFIYIKKVELRVLLEKRLQFVFIHLKEGL